MKKASIYIVVDVVLHEIVFEGTYKECIEWRLENGFGYRVQPKESLSNKL